MDFQVLKYQLKKVYTLGNFLTKNGTFKSEVKLEDRDIYYSLGKLYSNIYNKRSKSGGNNNSNNHGNCNRGGKF